MLLVSSTNPHLYANLRQALRSNFAADGGLFCPVVPRWTDWAELIAMPWPARGAEIVVRLADGDLDEGPLRAAARAALDIVAPLRAIGVDRWAFELFHGPTLAFKDFGARLLAQLLRLADDQPDQMRTVLTATSGDTGAAVVAAFLGVPGARTVVLYPAGAVSPSQERQIACRGGNSLALQVDGTFDQCQALVKQAFADTELSARLRLTSANSIHVGRLLAQITYFSEIVAQLWQAGVRQPPVVAVPCGNFGNLAAGLYAKRLGLPIGKFVVATNRNSTVPDFLTTGIWQPRPSVATPSNAMDVGAPNNWPRIEQLFDHNISLLRQELRWHSLSDEQTRGEIARLWRTGYLADPHTAVASLALEQMCQPGEVGVVTATAHPAKFAEIVAPLIGQSIELPLILADLVGQPVPRRPLAANYASLRAWLLATQGSEPSTVPDSAR
ncbi:MAG: threonine synthase [Myxococcales bacterium]|nr:threonine synthase [Myxococcales bacterium]